MICYYREEELEKIYDTFLKINFVYSDFDVNTVTVDMENLRGYEKDIIARQTVPAFCIFRFYLSRLANEDIKNMDALNCTVNQYVKWRLNK